MPQSFKQMSDFIEEVASLRGLLFWGLVTHKQIIAALSNCQNYFLWNRERNDSNIA